MMFNDKYIHVSEPVEGCTVSLVQILNRYNTQDMDIHLKCVYIYIVYLLAIPIVNGNNSRIFSSILNWKHCKQGQILLAGCDFLRVIYIPEGNNLRGTFYEARVHIIYRQV